MPESWIIHITMVFTIFFFLLTWDYTEWRVFTITLWDCDNIYHVFMVPSHKRYFAHLAHWFIKGNQLNDILLSVLVIVLFCLNSGGCNHTAQED